MKILNEYGSNSIGVLAIAALIFAISAVYVAFATRSDMNSRLAIVQQESAQSRLDQLADIDTGNGMVLGVQEENGSEANNNYDSASTQENTVSVVDIPEDARFQPNIVSNLGFSASEGVNLSALFNAAPSIVLENFDNGEEVGKAWLAYYGGKTYLRLAARNLDNLYGENYYEGWLVKNADYGIVISAGKLEYNASSSEAVLSIEIDGNVTDYPTVILSLEPNDGMARPYKILLRSSFPANTDFVITKEMLDASAVSVGAQNNLSAIQGGATNPDSSELLQSLLGNGSGNNQEELLKALLGGETGQSTTGAGGDISSLSQLLERYR